MIKTIVDGAIAPLHALTTSLSGATARLKGATIQKFGPDGKSLAENVEVDYSQARFDAGGNIAGGSVTHSSKFQGAPCSAGSIHFSADGNAASSHTTIYDLLAGGVHRVIDCDLSGLNLIHGRVSHGAMQVKSATPDGATVSQSNVVFAGEKLSSVLTQTQSRQLSEAVDRKVALDFSGIEFLGSDIVGGTLKLQAHRSDGHLLLESTTYYDATGLVREIDQTVYADASNEVRATVHFDLTEMRFDARGEVESGVLAVTAQRLAGGPALTGRLTYNGSVPTAYEAEIQARGAITTRLSIDYAGVRFNQARRPINSSLITKITDPDGTPISTVTVNYGPDGNPASKQVRTASGREGLAEIVSHLDCRNAMYDSRRVIVGGSTRKTTIAGRLRVEVVRTFAGTRRAFVKEKLVTNAETSAPRSWTKTYYRPDGTALKTSKVMPGPSGQPQTGRVTYFATDGKTVIFTRQIDYSHVAYTSAGPSGGTIGVTTIDGRGRARAQCQATVG
jgi:hypothetical protein